MASTLGRHTLMIAILLLALTSCNKTSTIGFADLKKSYFPLKLNSRIIYKMDSTVYSDFSGSSTLFSFELKDTVVSVFTTVNNEPSYVINRFKRITGGVWTYQKSLTRTVIDQRAEEMIDNVRYVRFIFPPSANKKWNGNTYNNLGEQTYGFIDVDASQTMNMIRIDSTASIKQIDETNLVREDYALEVYAKHIGLVKKEVRALDKDIATGKIRRGYKYLMQVKSIL